VRATRDAVTDIMRGVLAKVSQFSRSGEAGEGADKRAGAANGHSNGHSQSQSQSHGHGHSNHSSSSSSRGADQGPFPAPRGSFDEVVAQLKQEKTQLERRVRALEEEKESLSGNRAGAPPPPSEADSESALRARCDILTREREAVQTIMYVASGKRFQGTYYSNCSSSNVLSVSLRIVCTAPITPHTHTPSSPSPPYREQKIKVLVQSVANALNAVLLSAPSAGGQAGDALAKVCRHALHSTFHISFLSFLFSCHVSSSKFLYASWHPPSTFHQLTDCSFLASVLPLQDVAALQRLVNASISALRNASSSSSSSSAPSSPTVPSPRPDPPHASGAKVPNGINGGYGTGTNGTGAGSRGGYLPSTGRPLFPPPPSQSHQSQQQLQLQQQQQQRYSY
jgi:hypothetical protein